jgi:A/G-specific adenine glycosylase
MPIKKLTVSQIKQFQKIIYAFYKKNRRVFAWRNTTDPYKILVSEIMLQQTQTSRVEKKYAEFIKKFPNFKSLAQASLKELLQVWQGMGYNRRALQLQVIALHVITNYKNKLPADPAILQTFKGIGPNTAGSICAFAFNQPVVFIETNIRTVFIHHFFKDKKDIHDKHLLPLIEQTIDSKNPRVWYYALMDYGVYLKKTFPNPSRRSLHHTTQSKFVGSDRQIRGNILKILLKKSPSTKTQILVCLKSCDKKRVEKILHDLVEEKFIKQQKNLFSVE